MSRCLMIDAWQPVRMQLDGPSLIVQCAGEASRRFPLRLLQQIVVTGPNLDGLPAAIECAAQQINVYFLDGRGEIRAQLLGYFSPVVDWSEWLDQCRWNRSWLSVYEAAITQLWHCLCTESCLFERLRYSSRHRYYQQVATTLKRRWGKPAYHNVRQWLHGFAKVTVTQVMLEKGIAPSHRFKDRLLQDAVQLVFMEAWLHCYNNTRIAPPDSAYRAGAYYHSRAETWRSLLVRLFMSLEFRFTGKEGLDGLQS